MYITQEPAGFNYTPHEIFKNVVTIPDWWGPGALFRKDTWPISTSPIGPEIERGRHKIPRPSGITKSGNIVAWRSDDNYTPPRNNSIWHADQIQAEARQAQRTEQQFDSLKTHSLVPRGKYFSRAALTKRYGVSSETISAWIEHRGFPAADSAILREHGVEAWPARLLRPWERQHSKRRSGWPWDIKAPSPPRKRAPAPRFSTRPGALPTPRELPRSGNTSIKLPPPLLTAGEERDLFERWLTGQDRAARDEIVARFQPLCKGIVWKNTGYGVPIDDLIQAANLGILRALETFDPSKGFRFGTYAKHWIVSFVQVEGKKGAAARKNDARLKTSEGPPEDLDWAEITADDSQKRSALKAIDSLTVQEQRIIRARYLSDPRVTLAVLGKEFDVSAERIRQIEQEAIAKLQDAVVPGVAP